MSVPSRFQRMPGRTQNRPGRNGPARQIRSPTAVNPADPACTSTDHHGRVDPIAGFYDDLASTYHLIYPDWEASVQAQGEALNRLLREELGARLARVLDCACGIGTQLLGLSQHGHMVTGSDLSRRAVLRAARECAQRGLPARLAVADLRSLPFASAAFDAVVCADNALPHLLDPGEALTALAAMHRVLRPGGVLMLSTRDYDALRAERPEVTPVRLTRAAEGLVATLQLWDWSADGERYGLRHLQLVEHGDGWSVHERRGHYRAYSRAELAELACRAGFGQPRWLMPAESGFFQPLLLARR